MGTSKLFVARGTRRYIYKSLGKRFAAGVIDCCGTFLVWVFTLGRGLRPDPKRLAHPKKILVIRLDHIGDVLFCRPALQALRSFYPEANVTLLTSTAGASLLAREDVIDHVLAWDAPWFSRARKKNQLSCFWDMMKRLRAENYDLSLDLRGDLRHHILLFFAGVCIRAGYTITGGGFLLQLPCKLPQGMHEVERNLHIVRRLGAQQVPDRYAPLALTPDESQSGAALWEKKGLRVVVHPASGDPAKQWAPEYFAAVCDQLIKVGCEVILVGTAEEKITTYAVMDKVQSTIRDFSGQTGLRQLAAIIAAADCFVGNDSGPAHMAIVQECPAVMLWSETNAPEEWGPWGEDVRAAVVRRSAPEQEIAETVEVVKKFLREK
ncbi:glycosyltransferase family 9 protein [bacterium]|nr:glycosyltransferase family 9 protein [bacterium]